MDIVGGTTTVMRKCNDLMCNVIGLRVLGAGLTTRGTGERCSDSLQTNLRLVVSLRSDNKDSIIPSQPFSTSRNSVKY